MISAVLLLFFAPAVLCACTFPAELRGSWGSAFDGWDQLTFTNDTITGMSPEGRSLDFSCYENNGSTYVIMSVPYEVVSVKVAYFTCLDIVPSASSDVVYFRVLTSPHTNHHNFSVQTFLVQDGITQQWNISRTCQKPSTEVPMEFDVFLKKGANGFEPDTQTNRCPMNLHAEFKADFADDNTTCPEGFAIDGCADKSYLTFNYTQCNGTGDSYGSPSYMCLTSKTTDNTTYTTIYLPPATGSNQQANSYELACLEQVTTADGMLSIAKSAGTCGGTPSQAMKANETAECRVTTTTTTTTEAGSNTTMTNQSTPESTTSGGGGGQGGGGGGAVNDNNGATKIISGFATLSVAVILAIIAAALP